MNETDTYREWEPPAAWGDVVACCWEQRVVADRVQRVLPDGHADVLFYATGAIDVVGLYDEVALPLLRQGTWIRGVRLRPETVSAAFGIDGSSLRNVTAPAGDVLGARVARRLVDGRALDVWLRSIEPDRRTAAAVELLRTRSIDDVAAELEMSSRHIRRIMLADVGITPKAYQRVVRMQRFLQLAEEGTGLAVASAEAGYADQSHLTRDVRALSGVTPATLLDERTDPYPAGRSR